MGSPARQRDSLVGEFKGNLFGCMLNFGYFPIFWVSGDVSVLLYLYSLFNIISITAILDLNNVVGKLWENIMFITAVTWLMSRQEGEVINNSYG